MVISVASGKGGTGKTTVAVNIALSLDNVQFLDCDVEEPDGHLFLKPSILTSEPFGIPVPEIDESVCNLCGRCAKVCEFHAIAVLSKKVLVFEELCHSCGGCILACPVKAITEKKRITGTVRTGICENKIEFVDGILATGEAMSPPLIRQVKKKIKSEKITIIDCPPGTSCPVVESVKGSDFCILVTEPTPFGLNDLILAVETLRKLNIACGVIINRSNLGSNETENYCKKENLPILMKIPFDKTIAKMYSQGKAFVEDRIEYKEKFKKLFRKIQGKI